VDNELDWSLVYPELATGVKVQRDQRRKLCQIRKECYPKIRCYVKDAKIDGELMSSLGNSIKILSQLQKYCSTAESMASTKYSEELTMAANGIFK
jgi:hypothetical protein